MPNHQNKISKFWNELKRRKVVRVIIIYASTAFIILQLVDLLIAPLHLPEWFMTFIIVLLAIGFPIAVIFSWVFDVTPSGIEITDKKDIKLNKATSRRIIILDIIIGILLLLVVILAYPKLITKNSKLQHSELEDSFSLAVIPFENYTGNPALDFWQQGVSEYLLNALGSSEELTVISSHVVSDVLESFKNKKSELLSVSVSQEVARFLNVNVYVTGNLIGHSNNATIMVNLSRTNTGEVIWSNKLNGDLDSNYKELLGNVANSVKNYLELTILERNVPVEFKNAYPKSAEAYKNYIKGLNLIVSSNYDAAVQPLLKAVELDSTFTFAFFYLSWAYNYLQQTDLVKFWTQKTYENKQNLPLLYHPWIDLWHACYITKSREKIIDNLKILENSTSKSRLLWYDVAVTYQDFLHDYQKAIEIYKKVDELSDQLQDVWTYDQYYANYSAALLSAKKPEKAIKIAERGLILSEDSEARYHYYFAHVLLNNEEKIREALSTIEDFAENNMLSESEKERMKYILFFKGGDTLRALLHARKSYELDSKDSTNIFNLANVLICGDINIIEGLELVNNLLSHYPDNCEYLWLKGKALFKKGNYLESLEILNMARKNTDSYMVELSNDIFKVKQALRKEKTIG